MIPANLTDFATRDAAAWSGQDPARLASFSTRSGSLSVNGAAPAIGRDAIEATARGFMAAFPDMVVRMESLSVEATAAVFRWIWTGTNTGRGGTGRRVHVTGCER